MRKIKLLLTSLFVAAGLSAYAQTQNVTGTVLDSSTVEPIPAASVMVRAAKAAEGVAADLNGHFSIKA